jgi:hypothetical protein
MYFIHKTRSRHELPKLLANTVSRRADVVNETKLPNKLPRDSTAGLISKEWLHGPIVSPTELPLLASVVGLGIVALRLVLKIKRLIKK